MEGFYRILKKGGRLFVVVRSVENIPTNREDVSFDETTHLTSIPHYNEVREVIYMEVRYFHTPESIRQHLEEAGFIVRDVQEYQEQLYKDFMRQDITPKKDHVIEVLASK